MCSHSVVKLHEATQMFMMIDFVEKMTEWKCCKYGEYEPFEHLLFLVVMVFMSVVHTCAVSPVEQRCDTPEWLSLVATGVVPWFGGSAWCCCETNGSFVK